MSYRSSISHVLGESSLERKIRILFGVFMLFLIAAAFLSVLQITEEMIRKNTRQKASDLVETHLLRVHFEKAEWKIAEDLIRDSIHSLARTRDQEDYSANVLVLKPGFRRYQIRSTVVVEEFEAGLLKGLEEMYLNQQREIDQAYPGATTEEAENPNLHALLPPADIFPHSFLADNKYAYYEPIIFRRTCIACHWSNPNEASDPADFGPKDFSRGADPPVEAAASSPPSATEQGPATASTTLPDSRVLFMRVLLPYKAAKRAINRTRAILIAVGIGTVFLATLALYLIVRYVIVKPVRHLRDVADEVSHGRIDVRWDMDTGDEFEQLGRSFNRMLRHLTDMHEQLREANDDLDHKVIEQAQMNFKLHEMNKVKSEFLATMSHELRTPLNSIIGFSEVLEAVESLKDRERRFAGNIRKSGQLLLDLINDILDLAKLEAGRMEIHPAEFSIAQLITEQGEMIRGLSETRNIHLRTDAEPDLPEVYQDAGKVRQILTNLLSNAIKFTPEGGRIRLSARRSGDGWLELAVEDTGVGIPENEQNLIFEKFRQGPRALGGDNLTREIAGTGLGLSIVRELCGLLGGRIELDSTVGKGSTFTVRLPWQVPPASRTDSDFGRTLDELARSNRINFGRGDTIPDDHASNGEPNTTADQVSESASPPTEEPNA